MRLNTAQLEAAMDRAIAIAGFGPNNTPNPQVGCVLVDGEGRIVAEGWHRGADTQHAEVAALAALQTPGQAANLTAVVTLEPCNHTGRTGPCSAALRQAGVSRVVFACKDPGQVSGGGAAALRAAGIEVIGGVRESAAAHLVTDWLARTAESGAAATVSPGDAATVSPWLPARSPELPAVIAKWAQTIDGKAAAPDGTSQWITGPAARADVHSRRAAAAAIAVGTGTVLADNPSLTARTPAGELLVSPDQQPVPVVFGRRQVPADAKLREHPALQARGIADPPQYATDSGAALIAALKDLKQRGYDSVFIEGGPKLTSSMLKAGVVSELLIYVAPSLIGCDDYADFSAVGDIGVSTMAEIKQLRVVSETRLGQDTLIRATLTQPDQQQTLAQPAEAPQAADQPGEATQAEAQPNPAQPTESTPTAKSEAV